MAKEFTQEHIMKLCLPPELYFAVIQFQAANQIGKPHAGLLLITKAAYQEHLITKEVYEKYQYRYSRKLIPDEQPQKLTTEQQKEKQKMDEKARSYIGIYSQWTQHPDPKYRQRCIDDAKKWQDTIPEAKEFLQKVCK
jgi:hypothetical protein